MVSVVRRVTEQRPERIAAVVAAARSYDLREDANAWWELHDRSSNTEIDGVEVDSAGVIFGGKDRFRGLMNVYVVLKYDADEEGDGFTTSDAFQAFFDGHFGPDEKPVIDHVRVDTSPFSSDPLAVLRCVLE